MSKNESKYAWLDKKIEDHKKFIKECKKDIERDEKILHKIKIKSRKEDNDVTENC
jgi:hypothetical protein